MGFECTPDVRIRKQASGTRPPHTARMKSPASTKPLILSCSPRAGGNSDFAAKLAAETMRTPALFLRDTAVLPCVGCGACSAAAPHVPSLEPTPGRPYLGCPLSLRDASAPLLQALLRAPLIFLTAPIFFYHLPAGFKGLIDRLQPFWALREAQDPRLAALPERRCGLVLCAGRPKGEKLFEGSVLTLRWALSLLNIRLEDPLLLRGVDAAEDLAGNQEARDAVQAYTEKCASLG